MGWVESSQLVGGVISAGEHVWSVENIWTGCCVGERDRERERERGSGCV